MMSNRYAAIIVAAGKGERSGQSLPKQYVSVAGKPMLRWSAERFASDPQCGEVMQGTGGCRKVRVAGRGKGKSGGYRIIIAFGGVHIPVFLITAFGKGEKDNLTKAERNDLAKLTKMLFENYGR